MAATTPTFPFRQTDLNDLMRAWQTFIDRGEVLDDVRDVVSDAWKRCREYGLDPYELIAQTPDAGRLRRSLASNQDLIRATEPHLSAVTEALAGRPFLIFLLDSEGTILSIRGDKSVTEGQTNLFPGASWCERDMGVTAGGTALATGKPLVLIGPEHYHIAYHSST